MSLVAAADVGLGLDHSVGPGHGVDASLDPVRSLHLSSELAVLLIHPPGTQSHVSLQTRSELVKSNLKSKEIEIKDIV